MVTAGRERNRIGFRRLSVKISISEQRIFRTLNVKDHRVTFPGTVPQRLNRILIDFHHFIFPTGHFNENQRVAKSVVRWHILVNSHDFSIQNGVFTPVSVSQGKCFPDRTLFGEKFLGQRLGHHDLFIVIQLAERTLNALESEKVEEERVIERYIRQASHSLNRMFQLVVVIQIGKLTDGLHLIETVEVIGYVAVIYPVGVSLSEIVLLHAVHPFGVREAAVVAAVVADLRHEDHEYGQGGGEAEDVEDFWGFHI